MDERFYLLKIQLLNIELAIWQRCVVPAINQHLKRIFADNELTREATVEQYLIVQTEGNREVRRELREIFQ